MAFYQLLNYNPIMMVQRVPRELFARRFHLHGAVDPPLRLLEPSLFGLKADRRYCSEARLCPVFVTARMGEAV
jgi:hypothetical protein